ncbi:MAG: hypothetical protein ABWY20_03975 [Mycobacterium sp.]
MHATPFLQSVLVESESIHSRPRGERTGSRDGVALPGVGDPLIAAARSIQIWHVFSGEDPFDEATIIDDGQTPVLAEHPIPGHPAQPVK